MSEVPSLSPENRNVLKPLTATIKIGNEFAHIYTTPEALRSNLITEAVKQGIPEDVVREQNVKTRFSLDESREFLVQIADEERSFRKSLPYRVHSILRPKNEVLGSVLKKDGNLYCDVAVETIGGSVYHNYAQYPQEIQAAAVLQEIDAVWRHERQHLIQYMDPNKEAAMKREHTANKLIGITLLGTEIIVGQCLSVNSQQIERYIIQGVIGALYVANTLYHAKLSPSEKEASRMMKPEHYTNNPPFQIIFEN